MYTHRANNPRTLNMLTHDTTNRTQPHPIARDISPQTHERERSLTLHLATRITRCDRSFLTWTDLHTQPEFEAQHLYTRQKSPAQEPSEFRHVFHTRPNARLKEGGLRRSKHEFHFRASAWLVNLRVAGGLGVNTEITKMFPTPDRMSRLVQMDIVLHPDIGLVGITQRSSAFLSGQCRGARFRSHRECNTSASGRTLHRQRSQQN